MAVRDLSGRRLPTIEIDYSPAYEFLMTLIVFNENNDHDYEVGSGWFEAVRAKAGPDLLKALELLGSECHHAWKHLLGLAYDCEPPRDVPGFIEFHLLRGPEREDHVLYSSHSIWHNRADFEAWTRSEAFRLAHQSAGQNRPLYLGHPEFEGFEVLQTVTAAQRAG